MTRRSRSLMSLWRPAQSLLASALVVAGMAAFSVHASPGAAAQGEVGHRTHAAAGSQAEHHAMHRAERGSPGEMAIMMSPRMWNRVEATPEQREQIRKIFDAARGDLRAQHESGRALRQRSLELLSQPEIDGAALEALRKDMLAQQDRISQRRLQAMVDASRVLTPEQRKRLGEDISRRRDMMERHHRERRSLEAPKS